MKILTAVVDAVFDLFVRMVKKVCAIRKDDTPAQENALFLMLLILTLMAAASVVWISVKFPAWLGAVGVIG